MRLPTLPTNRVPTPQEVRLSKLRERLRQARKDRKAGRSGESVAKLLHACHELRKRIEA